MKARLFPALAATLFFCTPVFYSNVTFGIQSETKPYVQTEAAPQAVAPQETEPATGPREQTADREQTVRQQQLEADERAARVVEQIKVAAEEFIATLDEDQRLLVLCLFSDEAQKRRWSNLPSGAYQRRGLRWGDMNEPQREALKKLWAATLSDAGVQQIIDNMIGDDQLGGGRGRTIFGSDEYFVTILGEPSTVEPWMWQFGGHHLAINATMVEEELTISPSLTGGQPMDYTFEGREIRQLAGEEDKSFALVNALSDEQQKTAVLGTRYVDMIWGPESEQNTPQPQGLCAADMTDEQKQMLLGLIRERIDVVNEVHAERRMDEINQVLGETYFAWWGPTQQGMPATFRIQNPAILMEYSPQRLGSPTDHTHAIYRQPGNDYGRAMILKSFGLNEETQDGG